MPESHLVIVKVMGIVDTAQAISQEEYDQPEADSAQKTQIRAHHPDGHHDSRYSGDQLELCHWPEYGTGRMHGAVPIRTKGASL